MKDIAPTPWRIAEPTEYPWRLGGQYLGDKTLTILAADGYGVLSVPYAITDGPNLRIWEHVVRAVNRDAAFDGLLAALRRIDEASPSDNSEVTLMLFAMSLQDIARAAIAAATPTPTPAHG